MFVMERQLLLGHPSPLYTFSQVSSPLSCSGPSQAAMRRTVSTTRSNTSPQSVRIVQLKHLTAKESRRAVAARIHSGQSHTVTRPGEAFSGENIKLLSYMLTRTSRVARGPARIDSKRASWGELRHHLSRCFGAIGSCVGRFGQHPRRAKVLIPVFRRSTRRRATVTSNIEPLGSDKSAIFSYCCF
jgi:hypothetical protein